MDWPTFSIFLALVMLGWVMIYAVDYEEGQPLLALSSSAGRQLIWMVISFVTMLSVMLIDWKFWRTFAYPIYGLTLAALAGVLVFGATIKGAKSWYAIGGATIQPSEFAKVGACLAMAAFLSSTTTDLKKWSDQLIALGIILAPITLIILQPDPGSALVFMSLLIVLYREGFPSAYYIIGFTVAILMIMGLVTDDPRLIWILLLSVGVTWISNLIFDKTRFYVVLAALAGIGLWWGARQAYFDPNIALVSLGSIFGGLALFYTWKKGVRLPAIMSSAIVFCSALAYGANYAFYEILKPHQQDRINVWLQPDKCDPRGSLYNLIQSKMAISAGGLTGKGYLNGTMTRLNYVPEQVTDFIFTSIGEEHGFIGVVVVLTLFLFFLLQIVRIAERQRSNFSRFYAYAFAGIIFIHVFINIGMTMGLAPVIGIPLPFISRGGSSLLGFTIMLGILLKLDSKRFQI
ncbi:MAG: rod shape-determining protein RodA [Bacteroidota bacterium]